MRKLFPNFDREDGLETILEVPVPEELIALSGKTPEIQWKNMATWMKAQNSDKFSSPKIEAQYNELSFMLYLIGCPLIPLQVQTAQFIQRPPKNSSIEASTAKYIVQQYIAAIGGQQALNSMQSMCAVGKVKITASDFHQGDESVSARDIELTGGFVMWQKNPDLWCLELLVSGCKVLSGSNGKEAWRQSSNARTVTRGLPRPLRRFLQGLDPRSTANLFLDAVCIGEKLINDEDCFILKIDVSKSVLEAQSLDKYEIIHHTIWGYFSMRSGLLIKFEDSRLLALKTNSEDGEGVFWETSTESLIQGYKYVDGVNIGTCGKTSVTIYRYGEQSSNHRRELDETWKIEEVDYNVPDLGVDFFMPPSEIRRSKK